MEMPTPLQVVLPMSLKGGSDEKIAEGSALQDADVGWQQDHSAGKRFSLAPGAGGVADRVKPVWTDEKGMPSMMTSFVPAQAPETSRSRLWYSIDFERHYIKSYYRLSVK